MLADLSSHVPQTVSTSEPAPIAEGVRGLEGSGAGSASKPSPGERPRPDAGLYLVATPIGNIRDITLRALDVLAGCDAIYAEDTRTSRTLLSHYGIATPLAPYHEHNGEQMRPRILAALAEGKAVALISDAGTPLVSDPGYKLVRAAVAAGRAVTAVPGPSAPLAALILSGLPTDRFLFQGFLPPKTAARRTVLAELAAVPASLVFFEAARRLPEMLADLAQVLGAREAAVARELTKLYEEVRRGGLAELAAHYAEHGPPRGEVVVVVGPPGPAAETDAETVDRALAAALAEASLRDAVDRVTAATGRKRRFVYERALALSRTVADGGGEP